MNDMVWLARTAEVCQRLLDERRWVEELTIPAFLLKPVCQMCGQRFEPSEMVPHIPQGTDVRAACLSCWNDPQEWKQDEARRKRFESGVI